MDDDCDGAVDLDDNDCFVCQAAGDCNDQNACTIDFCTPMGMCVNMMLPNCCTMDSQCNDNDACTADSLVDAVEAHVQAQ